MAACEKHTEKDKNNSKDQGVTCGLNSIICTEHMDINVDCVIAFKEKNPAYKKKLFSHQTIHGSNDNNQNFNARICLTTKYCTTKMSTGFKTLENAVTCN